MFDKARTLLSTFFSDSSNHGVTTPALRRAIEAQAQQISLSVDERIAAWRFAMASATVQRRAGEQKAARLASVDGPSNTPATEVLPADREVYICKVTRRVHQLPP